MNVAPTVLALRMKTTQRYRARFLQEGDFDHAVDNSGDFVGLVADWLALECRRQPYPLAARGSGGCFDYQPRNRSTSGLNSTER
jgi:hypothetical protein